VSYSLTSHNINNGKMWIRKTEIEIKADIKKTRTSMTVPVLLFLTPFLGNLFSLIGVAGRYRIQPHARHFNEFITDLPYNIFWGALFAVIAFLYQYFILQREMWTKSTTSYICLTCYKCRNFNNQNHCKCGGQLESLNKMKWIDDK
jgi:hypothetical protein